MLSILIADDDLDGCDALVRFLRHHGYQVTCVPNGRQALGLLLTAAPDLLVLDLRMPEMDGFTLLEVIRSYLQWSDLPVLLVTGYCDDATQPRASFFGVKAVFKKGDYSFEDLLKCVREYVPLDPPPVLPN